MTRYQSAEYDVIRFDELTHFTESQFTYLLSRIAARTDSPSRSRQRPIPAVSVTSG
ncbi:MAG: hypothetical protein ACLSF2_05065 [Butyricicoccus sp.]